MSTHEHTIKRLVAYYIQKFGTNDPFIIAQNLGIKVFYGEIGPAFGMYKYIEHTKCIFINDYLEYPMKKVVMAHELGHAIMHWKENCYYIAKYTFLLTSRYEQEANKFAAYLLITDDMLLEAAHTEMTIDDFSSKYGIVDNELIKFRIDI